MTTTSLRALAGASVLLLAVACSQPPSSPAAKGSAALDAALPGGTPIALELAAPADGALVASPPGVVHVSGDVSLGAGEPRPDTALVYALDASTATSGAASCAGATTVLGCEVAALSALNARAVAVPTVAEVGAAIFGGTGAPLDLGPADGGQLLVAPGADVDGAGGPDVLQALASVEPDGTATVFAAVSVGGGPAQVGSGLAAAFAVADASARPARVVVLLSASAAGPVPPELVAPAGLVVRAFALPGTSCAAGLGAYAALGAAGSACEDVADLAALAARVSAVLDASLVSLDLVVDGGAPVPLLAAELPAAPPFAASFEETVSLAPGVHELCVRASGLDAGGPATVEECADVTVATIEVSPLEATHELGTPGQTATITATVAAGAAGGVPGVPVTFLVKTGPNASEGAAIPTGADGQAAFTYEARQHLEGLGTDEIEACFTDAEGTKACAVATVKWQDTTPPVVACLPGPNPGGVVSRRDEVGPSGFMTLVAVDAVDPAPDVRLVDTGSGTVWGPFESGEHVKYTQAPGAKPGTKKMGSDQGGGIQLLHVTGTGDPAVRGEDAVGNGSEPLLCPMPPWDK